MANQQEKSEGKKPSAIFGLLKAVAFLSVLVVVEVVAAALLIPSPHDTETLARELASARAGEEAEGDAPGEGGTIITDAQTANDEPTVEVEIGPFNVRPIINSDDANSRTQLFIDLELYATVLEEERPDFDKQFEANQNRVREQVRVTLQGADPSQLTEAGLGLIKRRILEKVNRALGKPLVREILVTRFNFDVR